MGPSEYELKRLENIKRNDELLRELHVPLIPKRHIPAPASKASKPTPRKKVKQEPQRESRRLRGIPPDSSASASKTEPKDTKAQERVDQLADIDQQRGFETLVNTLNEFPNTDPEMDTPTSSTSSSKELQQQLSKLTIQHSWATVKVTPERINGAVFHPSPTKLLAIAGDMSGNLGFWDTTAQDENDDPIVYNYRPHTRTITDLQFARDPSKLYTSSYDGTLQTFDMTQTKFETLPLDKYPITSFDLDREGRSLVYFSTSDGELGIYDPAAAAPTMLSIHALRDKKVGCIHLNPKHTHVLAAASNDRTATLWDVRSLKEPLQEHAHGFATTGVYWSPRGDKLATTAYDDYIRLFAFDGTDSKLQLAIKHNNHTGKWVTNFRPRWHTRDVEHQYFSIGNMNHPVDIYSGETGEHVAELYDGDRITAVPAVTQFHPATKSISLLCGNGSGRMVCWS